MLCVNVCLRVYCVAAWYKVRDTQDDVWRVRWRSGGGQPALAKLVPGRAEPEESFAAATGVTSLRCFRFFLCAVCMYFIHDNILFFLAAAVRLSTPYSSIVHKLSCIVLASLAFQWPDFLVQWLNLWDRACSVFTCVMMWLNIFRKTLNYRSMWASCMVDPTYGSLEKATMVSAGSSLCIVYGSWLKNVWSKTNIFVALVMASSLVLAFALLHTLLASEAFALCAQDRMSIHHVRSYSR